MRNKHYDVVVVGCGPGGAIAGKFAALNGAETLIIEEKRQLGFPVYDSMAIIFSKSEMEEVTGEKIESAAIYSQAKGLAYISPSGKEGNPQPLPDGIFVNRPLFEKSLAVDAVRAGAEIMLHSRVVDLVREGGLVTGVIATNGTGLVTIPCSLVIVAEGAYRQIARLAGMKFPSSSISAGIGLELAGVKPLNRLNNIDQIYLDETGQRMYRFVVPYGKDRFSIGVSFSPTFAKETKSLKLRINDFMRHLEEIGMYDFSKASPVNMMCGGRSHLTGLEATPGLASDGLMLVGDATGEPLFGCRSAGVGIMFAACWTGRAAGKIAAEAVRSGDVSGRLLNGEYRHVIDGSLTREERDFVLASIDTRRQILALDAKEQDRAIAEIGQEIAALHLCARGALASPFRSCLETAQAWLKEKKGR